MYEKDYNKDKKFFYNLLIRNKQQLIPQLAPKPRKVVNKDYFMIANVEKLLHHLVKIYNISETVFELLWESFFRFLREYSVCIINDQFFLNTDLYTIREFYDYLQHFDHVDKLYKKFNAIT